MPPNGRREHETGIKRIWEILGVPKAENPVGIERFRIGKCPKCLVLGDYGEWRILLLDEFIGDQEGIFTAAKYYLELESARDISAAWSEQDFAIALRGEWRTVLDDLYQAFQNGDIAVYNENLNPNPFGQALSISIISRIPDSIKQCFLQS